METICPRCNKPFDRDREDILPGERASIALTREQQEYLARNYKESLCTDCLHEIHETVGPVVSGCFSDFPFDYPAALRKRRR